MSQSAPVAGGDPAEPVFRVELLPAQHGDCIWLEYGSATQRRLVLIDGGPAAAFNSLETRIQQLPISERRFELLVVSHVDSDHIAGIIKLLGQPSLGVAFDDIWFNGWEQLSRPIGGFRAIADGSESVKRSSWEGSILGHRVRSARLPWNAAFDGQAICLIRGEDPPQVQLEGGLKLTLLSPDVRSLIKLRTAWAQALEKLHIDPADDSSISAALQRDKRYRAAGSTPLSKGLIADLSAVTGKLDEAVANGSSIAFLAEFAGRRCAFLADAHAPTVESSLARVAARRGERPLRIDVVKLSHHGSKGNTTRKLLNLIDCSHFLISTDGSQFGHPDDEAIARLMERGLKPVTLGFNYRSERTRPWDDAALKNELCYQTVYAPDGQGLVVDLFAGSAPAD